MRRFHSVILAALLLPLPGAAQEAVIRIEAKRGQAAAEAAADRWRQSFDDVMILSLPQGWTGIALGPMTPEEAAARLAKLKAEGKVPADSFIADARGNRPLTAPPAQDEATATEATVPQSGMELGAMTAAPPDVAAPDRFMRLEAFDNRAEADTALTEWRKNFPEAAIWQLPNDWFAIAVGPMTEEVGLAWLAAFKSGGLVPKDSFLSTTTEMGAPVVTGEAPDLPAPPAAAAEMPPLEDVQRALRWAGLYDGKIDGKDGPKTRAAIAAEVVGARLSPDPGTAMQALFDRRSAWQAEMGLTEMKDEHTGLSAIAPMERLVFERTERALSIYAPKDNSGAALILFSQPGDQQELLDLSGLVTALGWVPHPERSVERGHVLLKGENETHVGQSEGWVRDGRAEGYVLIWPSADAENQPRIAAELSDSLARVAPAKNDPQPDPEPAAPDAEVPLPDLPVQGVTPSAN